MKNLYARTIILGAALLAVPFSSVLRAALPSEVVQVLEASIEASGGREAISAVKSSRLTGSFSITAMGMKGSSEIVHAYPDKVYTVQELPGIGRMEQGFDGEKGWARDPMQGFRILSEGEVSTLKQNEGIASMLDFEANYSSGTLLPDAEVRGTAASVLKLVSAETGDEQTHYYSKDTGLLVQIDMIADMGPMGKLPASMSVTAYGEQDGIKFPTEMEMTNAGMEIVMTFDRFDINPEIDESIFVAPEQ